MKKIAVTVAVLALGLAGCNKTAADNTVNADTNVENAAEYDVNAATSDSMNAADNSLDAAGKAEASARFFRGMSEGVERS